ncbi:efflux RND transporter periplasmic adaptor subunit [Corynebacterium sp. H128]|uniref:efflux RND transporter periplasmic adaptor subunit n=1 Tax=Corynebacterium sp. H128 TaxID=3133427 RepID=UPI0030AE325A
MRKKLVAGIAALAVVGGGGAWAAASILGKDSYPAIAASEVKEVEKKDVVAKVATTGEVMADKYTSVTSRLTGPVLELKVRAGDKVQADQVLARMDTTELQRQVELQAAQQAEAAAAAQQQLATAQNAYQQSRDRYQMGMNPEINSATAALRQADSELTLAQKQYNDLQSDRLQGADPRIAEQDRALVAARDENRDAAIELARITATTIYGVLVEDTASPVATLDMATAEDRLDRAERDADLKQQEMQRTLVAVDRDLAVAQAKVADAAAAQQEAALAVESARLATLQQIDAERIAAEQAAAGVDAAGASQSVTSRHMQVDMSEAEVRAPHAGVISELGAIEGAAPEGVLLTVADTDRLTVTAKVKESEVGKLKAGDEVTFTTPATGDKKFSGNVVRISPVAQTPQAEGEKQPSQKAEFPVEIAVTGDKEGLRLGASAKLQIVVDKRPQALAVPREAVIKTETGHDVLILAEESDAWRVKRVPVDLVTESNFDAVITGPEIKAGTKVVTSVSKHEADVDKLVSIEG